MHVFFNELSSAAANPSLQTYESVSVTKNGGVLPEFEAIIPLVMFGAGAHAEIDVATLINTVDRARLYHHFRSLQNFPFIPKTWISQVWFIVFIETVMCMVN